MHLFYLGEQTLWASFLEKISLDAVDRAPWRFADFSPAPKGAKTEVLFTMVLGPVVGGSPRENTCTYAALVSFGIIQFNDSSDSECSSMGALLMKRAPLGIPRPCCA